MFSARQGFFDNSATRPYSIIQTIPPSGPTISIFRATISGDGNYMMYSTRSPFISPYYILYVYVKSGETYTLQNTSGSGNEEDVRFRALALNYDGSTYAVINTGQEGSSTYYTQVLMYNRTGSTWTQQGNFNLGTGIGFSVIPNISLSADGNVCALRISASKLSIFTRAGSIWSLYTTITLPTTSGGLACNISSDGLYISTGFYIYKNIAGTWTLIKTFTSAIISMSTDAEYVSLVNNTIAYGKDVWTSIQTVSEYGYLNNDGLYIALNDVYNRTGTTWNFYSNLGDWPDISQITATALTYDAQYIVGTASNNTLCILKKTT